MFSIYERFTGNVNENINGIQMYQFSTEEGMLTLFLFFVCVFFFLLLFKRCT